MAHKNYTARPFIGCAVFFVSLCFYKVNSFSQVPVWRISTIFCTVVSAMLDSASSVKKA